MGRLGLWSAAVALGLALPASAAAPRGIVVAADGTVYFTDLVKVRKIEPRRKPRVVRMNEGARTVALALAADGAIWGDWTARDGRQAIWRMRPDGSLTFRYGPAAPSAPGMGLLRDRHGCWWRLSESQSGAALVERGCPGGAVRRLFGSANERAASAGVADAGGTALDGGGALLFRHGGTLRRLAADGTVKVLARGLGKDTSGIAMGPQGTVLVAQRDARRVLAVSGDGRRRAVAKSTAPWAPTGVAWRAARFYLLETRDPLPGQTGQVRVRRIDDNGRARVLATVPSPAR